MSTMIQKSLSDAFGGAAADKEMQTLETVLRPLTANGFEFRGGDTFGQEIFSIYINDRTEEFAILRFNRPAGEPPLIHRGNIAELDQPMALMNTLPFVTVPEFLGVKTAEAAPRVIATPVAMPAAAPQSAKAKPGII